MILPAQFECVVTPQQDVVEFVVMCLLHLSWHPVCASCQNINTDKCHWLGIAFRNTSTTSRWLLRAAKWRAVNPSSLGSLMDSPRGRLGSNIFVALYHYIMHYISYGYLTLPWRAAWWSTLNPLSLVIDMSTCELSSNCTRFLEIASWRDVSPSEYYTTQQHPNVSH